MVRRKETELSEEEKFQLAIQTEQELARLARTYTLLERNRAQKCDTGGKLLKQRRVLDIFKREQTELLTDLTVATGGTRILEDDKNCFQLKELLDLSDTFDDEIKQQKFHLEEIDGQIFLVKKKVIELTSKQVTDEKYQQRVLSGEKTVQALENKLEVQIKKFCQTSADNIKLREEIQHLLTERNEFNKIWASLINNLCVGKKFMLDLIEQATIAYDQREDWVNKLQMLRAKAHNDLIMHIQCNYGSSADETAEHIICNCRVLVRQRHKYLEQVFLKPDQEMRSMIRQIDDQTKIQDFYCVKNQKRIMRDLEIMEQRKRQQNKENMEKKLERYLQILITIKEFTGEERVQVIANKFLIQEEENFAMFQYINHLNKAMEDITGTLAELHLKIDTQKELNEFRLEQQEKKLDTLTNTFDNVKAICSKKEEELKSVNETLKTVINGIGELFRMFKCKNDPLVKMLGFNESVTNHNVLLYLEILERAIAEAMINVHFKEKVIDGKRHSKNQMTMQLIKSPPPIESIDKLVPTSPCPLCVEHDQVSDVIDSLQIAVTREEAKKRLLERMEDANEKLHNVSACHLPKSRQIIQKRYQ